MFDVPTFPLIKHFMKVRRGGEKLEHRSFLRAAQRVYYLLNPHFHLISLTQRRSAPGDLVHGANVPVSPVPEEEDIEDISTPSIPHIPESSPGDDLGRCSPEGLDVSTIPSTSRAGVTPSSSTLEEIVPAKEESSDSDSETLATISGSSTGLEEAVVTEPSPGPVAAGGVNPPPPPPPPGRGFQLVCSDQYALLDQYDPQLLRDFEQNSPPGFQVTSVDPCIFPGKIAHRYLVKYQSANFRRCEDIRTVRHAMNNYKPQNSNVVTIAVIPGGYLVEYKQFCVCYRRGWL